MLIGITGKKNAGKSTVASRLMHTHGFSAISFADPMKEALAAMFGVPIDVFCRQDLKETPLPELLGNTPRHLMQTLGTDWARVCVSPTMWVDIMTLRLTRRQPGWRTLVVPDVRFDNEARAILDLGGVIWSVEGPHGILDDQHASEAGVRTHLISRKISNTHSIAHLHALTDEALALEHRGPDNSTII
jgi:hypothetical protein